MTYSSGMPALYFITFLFLFITYWTDKILVAKYFRKDNGYTADLSRRVVNMLPWALIVHIPIGYLMLSEPNILQSSTLSGTPEGLGGNQYFETARISQQHCFLFIFGSAIVILLIIMEYPIVSTCGALSRLSMICGARCKSCLMKIPYLPPKDENDEMIEAPDIYWEINFAQLVKEYKVQKTERQKYNILIN